jgi:hypothetical protein
VRVRYGLVLLLALEAAVWESFLVAARPFGHPLPLAAVVALAANVVLCLAGARVLGRPLGSALVGLVWLLVVFLLGLTGPGGDKVVLQTGRGVSFLLLGVLGAALATGIADARHKRASPDDGSRR